MLDPSTIDAIENEVVESFTNDALENIPIYDKIYEGDIPEWNDADRYYMVPARCKIPGEIIHAWLYDDFWNLIEKYLKFMKVKNLQDLATPEDLVDSETYREFCLEQCQYVEDYFWDFEYDYLANNYFLSHAEID